MFSTGDTTSTSLAVGSTSSGINSTTVSNGIAGIIGRAHDLLRTNARSVGSTVSNALSQQPKRRRLGHQYTPKIKRPEVKTLEVTVIDYADHADFADDDGNIPLVIPDYTLGKDDVLFTGTVDLMTNDKENVIRSKLVDVFSSRISGLNATDFSFVKVSRKIVSTPACKEGHKWDFPQIKAIKGQGKLYVRLEKSQSSQIALLSQAQRATSICSNSVSNMPDVLIALEETVPAQPSTSSQQQINIDDHDDHKDIEALQTMFPNSSVSYLSEIRRNNLTLQDSIDEILGESESNNCAGVYMKVT